ncbi:MAG: hypothetical protein PHF21_00625 [Bacilli bacterium]|nr:hypothetical protein [Bacilli bacterium]
MKLNNNGWGYGMMIILMSILFVFLLIAIYFIYRFYSNFEQNYLPNINQVCIVSNI